MSRDSPSGFSPDRAARKTEFILEGARSGSEAAWEELYERYRRMLLVAVECRMQGFLRRRFDAEDVLQEAFSKVYDRIESFRYQGEGSFRRWLRQIVMHEFKNLIKAQNRDRRRASRDESGTGLLQKVAEDPAPSQLLRDIEEKREVLEKMAALDEEEQEILTMRIFEQKPWGEIGEVLGCGRDAASARFDRIIALLARRLK